MWVGRYEHVTDAVLARALAADLKATLPEGDAFATLSDDTKPYAEHVRLAEFRDAARAALGAGGWRVADAICLGELLPETEFGLGFRTYIKRLSFDCPEVPIWHGFAACASAPPPKAKVARSVHLYHRDYLPHQNADATIETPEFGHALRDPALDK